MSSAVPTGWRIDPMILAACAGAVTLYVAGVRRYERRARSWPRRRSVAYAGGLAALLVAIESPLDAAGDARFAPHMVQHLLITDVAAPLVLLGAPLLLALATLPPVGARRIVRALRSPAVRIIAFPAVTWSVFVLTLWLLHFSTFFEAALEHESLHVLEHVVYFETALLFWLPVVAIGPVPWTSGALAYPLRMFYLLLAMPAQGFLGFALYGASHVLYAHYAGAGLADQQAAGELMWIGSGFAMFLAFMLVGVEWSVAERRAGEREDRRLDRI